MKLISARLLRKALYPAIFTCILCFTLTAKAQFIENIRYLSESDLTTEENEKKLRFLNSFKSITAQLVISFNVQDLKNTPVLQFHINGQLIKLEKDRVHLDKNDPAAALWMGKTTDGHEAELYINANNIIGSFEVGNKTYHIQNIGEDKQYIVEVNTSSMHYSTYCGTKSFDSDKKIQEAYVPLINDDKSITRDLPCSDKLRIMIVYTKALADKVPGIMQYCKALVTGLNLVYANSIVKHQAELAYCGMIDFDEAGNGSENLKEFASSKQAKDLRVKYGADLCVLMMDELSITEPFAGLTKVKAGYSETYILEQYTSSIKSGYISLAHEVGHTYGCDHDLEHAKDGDYDCGHAFTHFEAKPSFATAVFYSSVCETEGGKGCKVIPYYSNPDVMYEGIKIGNASSNNAAVMNLRAADMINMDNINHAEWPTATIENQQYASVKAYSLVMNLTEYGDNFVEKDNFVIKPGGEALFTSGKTIRLAPGFYAQAGSVFTASIQEMCGGQETHANAVGIPVSNDQSLQTTEGPGISIYPNPFTDIVNIKIDRVKGSTNADIKIYNIAGKLIMHPVQQAAGINHGKEYYSINTTSLSAGFYYCIITINGRQYVKKIVK